MNESLNEAVLPDEISSNPELAKLVKVCKLTPSRLSIHEDGKLSYMGTVTIKKALCKNGMLPFSFDYVDAFYCDNCGLTTLEGAPEKVTDFDCQHNPLESLDDKPEARTFKS